MNVSTTTLRLGAAFARTLRRRSLYPLTLLLLLQPALAIAPVAAGTLEVKAAAAVVGSFGLDVGLGTCRPGDRVIDSPAILTPGLYSGCATLTVRGVEVPAGTTTFTAGREVRLEEGFSVASGADLTISLDPDLDPFAYVEDQSPNAMDEYAAVLHLNLANATIDDGDVVDHFVGLGEAGVLFRVSLLRNVALGENRLVLAARLDDGSFVETLWGEQLLLPNGYNRIEVLWLAGAGDGMLLASVNSAPATGLDLLDNDGGRLDLVRWGAVSGLLMSTDTMGNLFLDEFSSFR